MDKINRSQVLLNMNNNFISMWVWKTNIYMNVRTIQRFGENALQMISWGYTNLKFDEIKNESVMCLGLYIIEQPMQEFFHIQNKQLIKPKVVPYLRIIHAPRIQNGQLSTFFSKEPNCGFLHSYTQCCLLSIPLFADFVFVDMLHFPHLGL